MKREGKNIVTKKILSLTLVLFLSVFSAFAQKKGKEKKVNVKQTLYIADGFFDQENYFSAAQEYEKVAKADTTNTHSRYRLGECYRQFFEYEKAEKWYGEAVRLAKNKYPLATFWYATMLKLNGNYVKAEEIYERFINGFKPLTEEDKYLLDRALFEYNGCVLALDEMKKPQRDYHFENLRTPVNSSSSDYAPVIASHDSIIVITSSREGSMGGEIYERMGETFSDNYRFQKIADKWETVPNTDNFSIVNSIRNDGAGVFTKDKMKYYFTQCSDPYDDGKYETHPCAIYVTKLVNGKWSDPIKLNKNINPPGVETKQPAISPKGDTLYFTSIRPGGYGMHDIWYSVAKGEDRWSEAKNLGPGVNTPFIEMSPCYHEESKTLFFASNGHEGFGGLDIFRTIGSDFKLSKNLGMPFNSNRDDFYFVLGKNKGYMSSNRDGGVGHDDIYWFDIKSHRSLIAIINKDSIDGNSLSIEGKILYEDTREPAGDVKVLLADKDGFTLKVTSTNDKGVFRFENLDALTDYLLLLQEQDPRLTAQIQYIIDELRLKASKLAATKTWFENIYFDFDQAYIRPEAAKVLDELVDYLKKNPQVQVEINANTDSFGADDYNDKLSQRRGKAALDYIKSKGVENTSIVINAMGEGKPIATNENPIGRQLNRRVEFFIVGGNAQSEAMTYVIEPKRTLYSIAKEFNMSVDELKQLNDIQNDNDIKAFRPIRVRRTGDNDIIAPSTLQASSFNKYAYLNTSVDAIDGTKSDSKNLKDEKERTSNGGKVKTKDDNKSLNFENTEDKQNNNTSEKTDTENTTENKPITTEKTGQNRLNITEVDISELNLKEDEEIYVVKPLDTLFIIAKDRGMNVDELKQLNNLKSDKIHIGQSLIVKKKLQ